VQLEKTKTGLLYIVFHTFDPQAKLHKGAFKNRVIVECYEAHFLAVAHGSIDFTQET